MDNTSYNKNKRLVYVNCKTFEKIKNPIEYFTVDAEIADVICLLNKKGYKTRFSCAGHADAQSFYRFTYPKNKDDGDNYKKFKESMNVLYLKHVGEDEDNYYYNSYVLTTDCYIAFEEKTVLPFLPEGFSLDNESHIKKYVTIRHSFALYEIIECNGIKRRGKKSSCKELKLKLKEAHKSLKEWVEKLPVLD